MSYYISATIVKGNVDLGLLNKMPEGLAFKAYGADSLDGVFLDVCLSTTGFSDPFQNCVPDRLLSQALPDKNSHLNLLRKKLHQRGGDLELELQTSLINLSLQLSSLFGTEVLCLSSDDNGMDFCARADSGNIKKLRFRVEDIEVLYENGKVNIIPLDCQNFGEERTFDKRFFKDTPFKIYRLIDGPDLLHYYSRTEADLVIPGAADALGLSSFDMMLSLTEIPHEDWQAASVNRPNKLQAKYDNTKQHRGKKPWWKFWM